MLLRLAPLAICAALASLPATADPSFYLGLEIGGGDVEVGPSGLSEVGFGASDAAGDNVLVGGFLAGMAFEAGWLAEVSFEDYDTVQFIFPLDNLNVSTFRIGAGYAPEPAGRVGFVAKAGLSFWQLEARESPLFNPGSEETFKTDGEDLYVQIGGEFHVTDAFRTGLVFDYSDTDFGNTSAIKLTLRYIFR